MENINPREGITIVVQNQIPSENLKALNYGDVAGETVKRDCIERLAKIVDAGISKLVNIELDKVKDIYGGISCSRQYYNDYGDSKIDFYGWNNGIGIYLFTLLQELFVPNPILGDGLHNYYAKSFLKIIFEQKANISQIEGQTIFEQN